MKTWVLLRGLTRESRHWGEFPDTFRRQIVDAEVCLIDLPGNGSLNRLVSPFQVPEMAENCRAQLRDRGVAPPYFLLAMSLGAMVAVEWAATQAQELAGAVLINTSMRPFSPLHHRLRASAWPRLLSLLLPASPRARESAIFALTSNLSAPPDGLIEPIRGFGKLWYGNDTISGQLGWGVDGEKAATGAAQRFANGRLIYSPLGFGTGAAVYVLYQNGTFETYPL